MGSPGGNRMRHGTVRIGPMVTPLSRRRVRKLARETVTLDLLSSGRLTLGVGLGSARNGELEPFGEVADPRERARLLDQGLDELTRYWAGESPRFPCGSRESRSGWARSGRTGGRCCGAALGRDLPHPRARPSRARGTGQRDPRGPAPAAPFDVVVPLVPGADAGPWEQAGATWVVTDFGPRPTLAEVREEIDAARALADLQDQSCRTAPAGRRERWSSASAFPAWTVAAEQLPRRGSPC